MNDSLNVVTVVHASAELGLPLPRLQLTWFHVGDRKWVCRYDILVPVGKYDIRNGEDCGFAVAHMGTTEVDGAGPLRKGELDTPFRDGAHAAWDSKRLGWPAFVVYGDRWERVKPRDEPMPIPET